MTNSFQRCASGQWSVIMNCAAGTICSPAGLTIEFRIQHDGTVDGSGGRNTGGAVGRPAFGFMDLAKVGGILLWVLL